MDLDIDFTLEAAMNGSIISHISHFRKQIGVGYMVSLVTRRTEGVVASSCMGHWYTKSKLIAIVVSGARDTNRGGSRFPHPFL